MDVKPRRKHARNRGLALAETAIVITLLVLIVMAALEYGWMFMNIQRITNAARHGARVAAAFQATTAEGQAAMESLLTDLPATCSVVPEASPEGPRVVATASVPSNDVRLIHWDLLPMPVTLQATVRMAKEGG
jgi:Flp pilus assembly protein TadG